LALIAPLKPVALALLLALSLSSCGSIGASVAKTAVAAAVGGGSGPSLDVQAGKENNRAVNLGYSENIKGDKITRTVEADSVERVVVNEIQPWVILLLVLGWLLPSPNEIARWIRGLFKRNAT
jgi:hypothetical protein